MYQRPYTRIEDKDLIAQFIKEFNFAMIITENPLQITHLPLILDADADTWMLYGHFARANNHWINIASSDVIAVFNGPHGYISPKNYTIADVPTWNYSTIHVKGHICLIEDPEIHWKIIKELVEVFEKDKSIWSLNNLEKKSVERQIKATVAFKIEVSELDAKFKMSQNRPLEDRKRIIKQLRDETTQNLDLADFMEKHVSHK